MEEAIATVAWTEDPIALGILALVALGASYVAILGLRSLRRARHRRVASRIDWQPTHDDATTSRIRELERRERELLSFFVNFPEQVRELNSSFDVPQIAEVISAACRAMLGASGARVFLLDERGTELRLVPREVSVSSAELPQRWLLAQRLPVTAEETRRKAPGTGAAIEVAGRALTFQLATPIRLGDTPRGLITVEGLDEATEHARKILACLANVSALSLENALRMEHALYLADLDRMTELYNHAYFQRELAREVHASVDAGRELSLFLLDVDHFKAFNDREGHPAGDALLGELARLLRGSVRRDDLVARYGGEEFAVLMPDTGEAEALEIAERIRACIAAHPFEGGAAQPLGCVTVSGGVASLDEGLSQPGDLVHRADVALYQAKQLGRDRVQPFVAEFDRERRRGDRRRLKTEPPRDPERSALGPDAPPPERAPRIHVGTFFDPATDDLA